MTSTQQFNHNHRPDYYAVLPPDVTKCPNCDDDGHIDYVGVWPNKEGINCPYCNGVAYLGIDIGPTARPKGSEHRVLLYRARYQAGVPLYDGGDKPDHEGEGGFEGPDEDDDDDESACAWLGV